MQLRGARIMLGLVRFEVGARAMHYSQRRFLPALVLFMVLALITADSLDEGPCMRVSSKGLATTKDIRRDHCFDVATCANIAQATRKRNPRYSLVLTHTLESKENHRFRPEMFWSVTAWQRHKVESVLMVPACPAEGMPKPGDGLFCNLESRNR